MALILPDCAPWFYPPGPVDPWACKIAPPPPCPPPCLEPCPKVTSFSTQLKFPLIAGSPSNNPTATFAIISSSGIHGNVPIVQSVTPTSSNPGPGTVGVTVGLNFTNVNALLPATLSMRVVAEGNSTPSSSAGVIYESNPVPITMPVFNVAITFSDGKVWDDSTTFTIYIYSS